MSKYLGFEPSSNEEFYFVSYNNDDAEKVSTIAKSLNDAGVPLWYDDGIEYGKEWAEELNQRINDSLAVILFFTKGILYKEQSYVQKEWKIANLFGKRIFVLFLDDMANTEIPVKKMNWWVDITDKQSLDISKMSDLGQIVLEIKRALKIQETAVPGSHAPNTASSKTTKFSPNIRETTLEKASDRKAFDGILLGDMDTEEGRNPFLLPISCLSRNVLITGAPASGKATLAANFLTRACQKDLNFIAFEFSQKKYRCLSRLIKGMKVFRYESNSQYGFRFNIFIPPKGINISQYIVMLSQVLQTSLKIPEEYYFFIEKALRSLYEKNGWLSDPEHAKTIFGIKEFADEIQNTIYNLGYSQNIFDKFDMKYGMLLRMISEQYNDIFATKENPDIRGILHNPSVYEMGDILYPEVRKLLTFGLLLHINIQASRENPTNHIKQIILLDDMDQLLDGLGDGNHYSNIITTMINEARAYGLCYVITSAVPSRISYLFDHANIGTVIAFRLFSKEEADFIAKRIFLENGPAKLLDLETGIAYVRSPALRNACKVFTYYFPMETVSDEELDMNQQL